MVAFGELYYGAYLYFHRHASTKYLDLYDIVLNRYREVILPADEDTIHFYAAIAAELTVKGVPMQQNDIWIAALARQHGLTLATRDHDFERVSELSIEFW